MSGAGQTANVALRPWPAPQKEALNRVELFSQIDQLARERGHLRFITEEALQDELDSGKDANAEENVQNSIEDKQDAPTKQDRAQEIAKVRHEMTTRLEWATFYVTNALDLVAQILTKDPAKHVTQSFSHQFKEQRVPPGSIVVDKGVGVNKVHLDQRAPAELEVAEKAKQSIVARGSRMKSLDQATDILLEAAAQLRKEVRKENTYWNEVLSISQSGWSLQRLRKDSRRSPFAVRYGFPEASPHLKSRGLASLRMDENGSIVLDPALSLQPKTVRIRISDNGRICGTSSLRAHESKAGLAIERSIQLAKDSLFEEELYHELSLESRELLSYNVELRDTVIHMYLPDATGASLQKKVLIDCIPRDDSSLNSEEHEEDWLAHNIAEALRLLLSHEHRMRLLRRSQIPLPMTQHERPQHRPPLLRTVIAVFWHLYAVDLLQEQLNQLTTTFKCAGLQISVEASREISWASLTSRIKETGQKDRSLVDYVVNVFTRPFEGLVTISLPSSNASKALQPESITISTRTHIGNPHYGTEFTLTIPNTFARNVLKLSRDQRRDHKFTNAHEVVSYLEYILSLDLAHAFLFTEYKGRAFIKDQDARVIIASKSGKKQVNKSVMVDVQNGSLKVVVASDMLLADVAKPQQSFTWDGSIDVPSFREKIKSLVG